MSSGLMGHLARDQQHSLPFYHRWKDVMVFIAEHRRPKAAMRSPIAIEPCIHFRLVINASGKWFAGAYVRRRRRRCRTIWRPYSSTYALHTSMQLDIGDPFYSQLTAVKSWYPLTSTTWPFRGLRLELIEVKCFFLSWPLTRLCIFNGSRARVFSQIIRTSQTTGAPLLGLA